MSDTKTPPKPEYPQFSVPGIDEETAQILFNIKNYSYYLLKVAALQAGKCGLCEVDPTVNTILSDVCNSSWLVWKNTVVPDPAYQHKFMVVPRRHVTMVSQLTPEEGGDLIQAVSMIDFTYGITGGALLARSGAPNLNARSEMHLHFQYLVPLGTEDLSVTIGKSVAKLRAKLEILIIFEKMRQMEIKGLSTDQALAALEPGERTLVQDKLGKKKD